MTVVLEAREDFTLEAFRRVAVDGEDVTTRPGVEVGTTIPLRNGAAGADIARMQDMPGSAGVLEERLARERGACRVP
jgi:hypothetical protein